MTIVPMFQDFLHNAFLLSSFYSVSYTTSKSFMKPAFIVICDNHSVITLFKIYSYAVKRLLNQKYIFSLLERNLLHV